MRILALILSLAFALQARGQYVLPATPYVAPAGAIDVAAVQTANATLIANTLMPFDCTAGNLTASMPSNPTNLMVVEIKKVDATTNTLTLTAPLNGNTTATPFVFRTQNQAKKFIYRQADGTWWSDLGDVSIASLDSRYGQWLWNTTSTQATTATAVAANVAQSALPATGAGSRSIKPVAGNVYHLHSRGTYQTPTVPGAVTVNVVFNGTNIATVTVAASVLATSSVNNELYGDFILICRSVDGSNVGTFSIDGSMSFQTAATGVATVPISANAATVTASIGTTGGLLDITESWSTVAAQGTKISTAYLLQIH